MRKGIPALLLTLSLLLCGCRLLPERIPPAGLTVHFLDVGQADCALLESGGAYMLIDGGNREDGRLVVSYLEQQGVEELVNARKVANRIADEREKAVAYHDTVVPKMEAIRYHIDKLELCVSDELWTQPKYRELLFIR